MAAKLSVPNLFEDIGCSKDKLTSFIDGTWDSSIVPALCSYIAIPNQSPGFDAAWETNGLIEQAVGLIVQWIESQQLAGSRLEVLREAGRTPLIFLEVDASANGSDASRGRTVLMYGHCDKQPPMTEFWEPGLGPYTPVMRDGKLYGRGGADDGYAAFAAVTAIKALQLQDIAHPRICLIIEACEESGSQDLPYHVDLLAARLGTPELVICLDSGCGDYERMWLTTSLRGNVLLNVDVQVVTEGVHSGAASGIVPSSFRIMRVLLDRLEDSKTGCLADGFHVPIPQQRLDQAAAAAAQLGETIYSEFPWAGETAPSTRDLVQLLLARTWRPTLCVTGAAGLPEPTKAGNVLRTNTTLKLSIRTPPTASAEHALELAKSLLTRDVPQGAKVTISNTRASSGWSAPLESPQLASLLNYGSKQFFGADCMYMGEGGSIPFMGMLGEKFPAAQFVITGVLGPKSNAHGPNEFIDIGFAKRLTCCVATVLAGTAARVDG